jgi:hypothetical protein
MECRNTGSARNCRVCAHFLAFRGPRADAGLGADGGNAGATGADAVGDRALHVEFELELAGELLLSEKFVLADIEHVPFRWKHLNDENMLHLVDLVRFLIDHMVPCDRKAL